tara:strand:+ start:361 stop:822 length:462 start_codon:yes stop_codon:yes gene_type:complete
MSKIFEKYKTIILDDAFTESSISSFRSLMNGRKNTNLTDEEKLTLFYIFENQAPYSITPAQTTKGLDWLFNLRFTMRGKERKNNPFGYREQSILDDFDRFELSGLYDDSDGYNGFHNFKPIYKVIASDEGSFEYVPFTRSDLISGQIEPLIIY